MRFIVFGRTRAESNPQGLLEAQFKAQIQKYNTQLIKAGVLLASEELYASREEVYVVCSGENRATVHERFEMMSDPISALWVLEVRSKEEAIEWARRYPNPPGLDVVMVVRQVHLRQSRQGTGEINL